MPYILDLLYSQLLVSIPLQTTPFTNQTIIVTGSNTGLGLEASRLLIQLNAGKVILAVRSLSKGEAAAASIINNTRTKTGYPISPTRLEVWLLDMSSPTSIQAFAQRASKLDRLDAAILNAGILNPKRVEINGTESHLAINTIGTILLEFLLLPILQRSAARTGLRGRMTLVGSDLMYTVAPADLLPNNDIASILSHLNTPSVLPEGNYYAYSKWLVYQASRRIALEHPVREAEGGSNVIVSVQTPGACKSTLFREEDVGVLKRAVSWAVFAVFARSTEAGARTLVQAVGPGLGIEAHGGFLMDCLAQG
jgi:NAD(P)-dependent dehydrogenase (short-subunit alcohol dehydrogenase family)